MTKKTTYSLNTPSGVRALLRDRHYLGELRKRGDMNASDILIDLDHAITSADITGRQAEAIAYVYGLDLTRGEAATQLGVTRQAVDQLIWGAAKRIAAVYRAWDYGEITIVGNATNVEEDEVATS